MNDSTARVDELLDELDEEQQRHEKALAHYVKRLQQARDEIEFKLRRATASLAAMRGDVADPLGAEASIRRMGRREAERRRAEAGQAVYDYMASKPKVTHFSFGEVQEQWNADRRLTFTTCTRRDPRATSTS